MTGLALVLGSVGAAVMVGAFALIWAMCRAGAPADPGREEAAARRAGGNGR